MFRLGALLALSSGASAVPELQGGQDGCAPGSTPLFCCSLLRKERCPGVDPKGPCCRLHAKSQAKQAPKVVSKEAQYQLLRLKLRLIACAHARVTGERPQVCGPRCLKLLETDLEEVLWAGQAAPEEVTSRLTLSEEVAAASLCYRLLRFHYDLLASAGRYSKKLPRYVMQEFAFLWEMAHFLDWQRLFESGWPVFGLFRLVVRQWPTRGSHGDKVRLTHQGNATATACQGASVELLPILEVMSSKMDGEGLRIPNMDDNLECGWQEALAQMLMSAWLIYQQNSHRYHTYNDQTGSFDPLPDLPYLELTIARAREQSLLHLSDEPSRGQRGQLETTSRLLQSKWDPWELLSSMEVFYLFRSWRLFKEILPEKPTIVEAGANDGIHEAIWLEEWPRAHIFAFEPDPNCFLHLQRNMMALIAPDRRVKILNMALSGEKGQMDFYLRAGNFSTSAVNMLHEPTDWFNEQFPQISWETETVKVATTPLDSLIDHGVQTVDFLELDVQCHEYSVLKPSQKILPTITIMQIEACLPPGMCKGTALFGDIQELLADRGFALLATDAKPDSMLNPQDRCFDALFVNLAKEPTAALAALEVARALDGRHPAKYTS